MRRAARVDANHQQIRSALEAVGWCVIDTSRIGDGFSDLVCARRGVVVFVEVKDGSKPPSDRRLTPAEEMFRMRVETAGIRYHVVTSIPEAVTL